CAERNIFQNLKLLLKREPRHEDGAADQDESESQQNMKNFLACELGQSVRCDRGDAAKRERAVRCFLSRHSISSFPRPASRREIIFQGWLSIFGVPRLSLSIWRRAFRCPSAACPTHFPGRARSDLRLRSIHPVPLRKPMSL